MNACQKIIDYTRDRYQLSDYAALAAQYDEWLRDKPLAGLTVLDATPLFANTLLKYRNLIAAGADLTIGLSPFISYNADALRFVTEHLGLKTTREQGSYDLVLDCAGAFSQSEARIGYVELTRSGLGYYSDSAKPVFLADSSRIKEIETEFGTGESLFRALEKLGFQNFEGKRFIIFGSGKVGRGILREALERRAAVTMVTDPSTVGRCTAATIVDYRDRELVHRAIGEAWAVVMATGVKGALSATIDPCVAIDSAAILINMGAEDEFGDGFDSERLLEGGRTLNFILDEPTHLRFIDPTMSLHNYGAQFLKDHPHVRGVVIPDKDLEDNILKTTYLKLS